MAEFADLIADVALFASNDIVAKHKNELKDDNFIVQCRDSGILTLRQTPECKEFTSSTMAYEDLYFYLVMKNVITNKIESASAVSLDFVNTINPAEIETDRLKQIVKEDAPDLPKRLRCYTIHHEKLSTFLKNYQYSVADQVKLVGHVINEKNNGVNTPPNGNKSKKTIRQTIRRKTPSKKPRFTPKQSLQKPGRKRRSRSRTPAPTPK
jgi:hypothetical protein